MAEGTEVGTAYVSILPSAAGFGAALERQVTGAASSVGRKAGKSLGDGVKGSAEGIARSVAGALAAAGAAHFFKGALDEAQEAARVGNLTNAVIKSTGGVAGVTADQIGKLANSLSKVAGVDDEVIQAGENVLLTFTSVRNQVGAGNDIFNQATKAALDMSAALGTDLQGSIIQLGKALNDPVQGMTALRRVGVSFTESQQAQIKAMQEAGNLLGAQKLILGELTKEFGGAAAANATALDRMHVAVLNAKEAIGTALLPAINAASSGLTEMLGVFTAMPGPVQSVTAAIVGLGAASIAIALFAPRIRAARAELEGMGAAGATASRGLGLLGRAGLIVAGTAALVGGLKAVRDKAAELSGHGVGSIPKLTDDIAEFLLTGKTVGDLADQFGTNLAGIGKSLKEFTSEQGGFRSIDRLLDPAFSAARDDIDSLDKTLAELVSGGHKDAAVKFFNEIVVLAGKQGVSVDNVTKAFNDYGGAMSRAAADGKLAEVDLKGAGDAAATSGDTVAEAEKKWDSLRKTLDDLVESDWSKKFASDLTSALNPLELFTVGAGKDIDDLKSQVQSATAELTRAKEELAKLEGTATPLDDTLAFGAKATKTTAGQLDEARAHVTRATGALTKAQQALTDAQKSPLKSLEDNLTANLKVVSDWEANLGAVASKIGGTAGDSLLHHLGALGPGAADAVAEASRLSKTELGKLEGLFEQADQKISDAASGAFELSADQAAKPAETLAQIISDRYQKSLIPKFTQATLAALNEATSVLLGLGATGGIQGAFPTTEPGPGEARVPPALLHPTSIPVATAPTATTSKTVVVNVGGPVPDPTLLGRAIAWEI